MERSMSKPVDLSKSLAALDQDSTLIVVIELSQSSWLAAARAPGVARDPLKKLKPDPEQLFRLIDRWREESRRAGRVVRRVCGRLRGGARRLLARAVAAPARHRGLCHPSHEHPGEAGSSPRQDGSAGHGAVDARFPGLAARRG